MERNETIMQSIIDGVNPKILPEPQSRNEALLKEIAQLIYDGGGGGGGGGDPQGYVTPEMFGAIGDGKTDDSEALMSAFSAAFVESKTLYFPNKSYFSSTPLVVESVPDVLMDGTIIFPKTGNGLTLGKPGEYFDRKRIRINVVSSSMQDAGTGYFGIQIINAQNSTIDLQSVQGFDYGAVLNGNGKGFAYNKLFVGHIRSKEKSLILKYENTGGYVNENLFIGGRFVQTSTETNVAITLYGNHNTFLAPCCELAGICFDFYSSMNKIISCRTEASTYVAKFNSDTYFNEVEVDYGPYDVDGFLDWNTVTYNTLGNNKMDSVNSKIIASYPNVVFDGCYISDKVTIGSSGYETAVSAPLFWLDGNERGIRHEYISVSKLGKSGTEVVLEDSGCIGVMVDCTIAKDFMLQQNGSNCGYWAIKLFDANGDQLDMSDISIGPHTTYYTTWGGILYHGMYPISQVTFPAAAKKAFIAIAKATTTSILTFSVRSKNLSVVLPE